MPGIYLTFDKESGAALLEETPTESCFEVTLAPEEMATLAALMQLDSYRVARAAGALAMFCFKIQHRQSRRDCQPGNS